MTSILVVEDNPQDIAWLFDFLETRSCSVRRVANGKDSKKVLDTIKSGETSYSLAIFDIMVATMGARDLVEANAKFFEDSREMGIELCRYAREVLKISPDELPIVCISSRFGEPAIHQQLDELGVPLFGRIPTPENSLLRYLENFLRDGSERSFGL